MVPSISDESGMSDDIMTSMSVCEEKRDATIEELRSDTLHIVLQFISNTHLHICQKRCSDVTGWWSGVLEKKIQQRLLLAKTMRTRKSLLLIVNDCHWELLLIVNDCHWEGGHLAEVPEACARRPRTSSRRFIAVFRVSARVHNRASSPHHFSKCQGLGVSLEDALCHFLFSYAGVRGMSVHNQPSFGVVQACPQFAMPS